jgi:hypothetical protein
MTPERPDNLGSNEKLHQKAYASPHIGLTARLKNTTARSAANDGVAAMNKNQLSKLHKLYPREEGIGFLEGLLYALVVLSGLLLFMWAEGAFV